jgi:hypothetical protein
MHYAHILTSRITRTILGWIFENHNRVLPLYGEESQAVVNGVVRALLESPESPLADMMDEQYAKVVGRFGCPFSVEEALILGCLGFNAEPMQEWLDGKVTIDRAIEVCFEQTFWQAFVEEYTDGVVDEPEETPEEPELKLVKN